MVSDGRNKETIWLKMDNLQSRKIPDAKFPEEYSLHTWQDGCEEEWFCVVKESFEKRLTEGRSIETFKDRYFCQPQFKTDGFFLVKHKERYVATVFSWQEQEVSTSGRLHWLAVLPEHRGKGIGRALCLCVIRFFQELGKTSVLIKTENYRDQAIRLYENLGFVKVV